MGLNMNRRSKISKRVTWAPDANLRQILLFGVDDCPSEVGTKARALLQAKRRQRMKPDSAVGPFRKGKSMLSVIRWKCPPRLIVRMDFPIAAGEESEEKDAQSQREKKVFEAVYPRLSFIPPRHVCPALPVVEECEYNDHLTLIIPTTPIEDDAMEQSDTVKPAPHIPSGSNSVVLTQDSVICTELSNSQSDSATALKSVDQCLPPRRLGGSEADVVSAASAALTARVKSKEQGSMVDMNLLIKILSDPKMVEKLKNIDSSDAVNGSLGSESQIATLLLGFTNPEIENIARKTTQPARSVYPCSDATSIPYFPSNRTCITEPDSAPSQKPVHVNRELPLSNALLFSSPNRTCSSTASSSYAQVSTYFHQKPACVNSSMPQNTMHENADYFQNSVLPVSNALSSLPSRSVFTSTATSYAQTPMHLCQKPEIVKSGMPHGSIFTSAGKIRDHVVPVSNRLPSSSRGNKILLTPPSSFHVPRSISERPDYVNSSIDNKTMPSILSRRPGPELKDPSLAPVSSVASDRLLLRKTENIDRKLQNSNSFQYLPERVSPAPCISDCTERGVTAPVPQKLHHAPKMVSASLNAPLIKDQDYLKNLIKEHGKETGYGTSKQMRRRSCPFQQGLPTNLQAHVGSETIPSTYMGAYIGSGLKGSKRIKLIS